MELKKLKPKIMKKKALKLFERGKFLAIAFSISLFPAAALAQWNVGRYSGTQLPSGSLYNIIENILKWLLIIFGFIAIIGFVISGIMYLTAAGDEKRQEKAKNQMYWSITGVIVGLMGYIVIKQINEWLNAGGAGLP
jgi:glucose uptake protein GlcU